jgi:HAD superfamily hydrolase (TIGR01662 family)
MIKGVLLDLGDTIIEQQVDLEKTLDLMELKPFPEAKATLSELKSHGFLIAIVSNTCQSSEKEITKALDRLDLLQFVDSIVTSTDVGEEKPSPKVFLTAIESLGLSVNEVVMVGDDIIKDIGGAQNLGIVTILVNRNKTPFITQHIPTFVVSKLDDIPLLLKSYFGHRRKDIPPLLSTPRNYEELSQAAQAAQDQLHWDEAARLHAQAANHCLSQNDYQKASVHFMHAARCREQGETWHDIGALWLQTSHALELSTRPRESKEAYEDYDASQHFFLGIAPG